MTSRLLLSNPVKATLVKGLAIILCLCASKLQAAMPAEAFFTPIDLQTVRLSPDGKLIAKVHRRGDTQHIEVLTQQTGQSQSILDVAEYASGEGAIRRIAWIDSQHIAAQFVETKKGIKDLLDTRLRQSLLIIRIGDTPQILSVRTKGWMVHNLPQEDGAFLYAKSGVGSKIYKLDVNKLNQHKQRLTKLMRVDGGQFVSRNVVASVKGYATRWFTSTTGEAMAALYYKEKNELALGVPQEDGSFSELKVWDTSGWEDESEQRILPVAFAGEENVFYCLDFAETEARSVYKVDFAADSQTLFYEADSYRIIDLILDNSTYKLLGVKVLRDGEIRNVYLDDASVEDGEFAGLQVPVSVSNDQATAIVYRETHTQPGHFVVQQGETNAEADLGGHYPHLMGILQGHLIESEVEVEGLSIPYLLTLPDTEQPAPLVVMPHGGPIGVFDTRYFDLGTQFLAANGYAVLRVNYRGSSGYSKALKEAGTKQWGGLILQDILAATQDVLKRDDLNAQHVCVVGMSYGGYAATMLTMQYPELFQCGVNIAGVSDINLYLNHSDRTGKRDKWLREHVGDTVTEYEAIKAVSPVYLADNLQRPLLIMHGAKDETVDVEHAYRLKRALDKHQRAHEFHVFEEGTHSYGSAEDQADLFSRILSFVQQSLKQKSAQSG